MENYIFWFWNRVTISRTRPHIPNNNSQEYPRVLTFNNDAKQLPKWILHEYHLSQNGLRHFEMFTWQNLTLADMVIPFATPTYQP